jgi:hypothetical protein
MDVAGLIRLDEAEAWDDKCGSERRCLLSNFHCYNLTLRSSGLKIIKSLLKSARIVAFKSL